MVLALPASHPRTVLPNIASATRHFAATGVDGAWAVVGRQKRDGHGRL